MRETGAMTGVAIGAIGATSGVSLAVDAGVFSSETRVSGFGTGAGADHARPTRVASRICK